MLDLALRVGGVLLVVGLLTTAVIIGLYLAGAPTPGTWAYLLAMTAPLGLFIVLVSLLGVAMRRRRASLDGQQDPGSQAP